MHEMKLPLPHLPQSSVQKGRGRVYFQEFTVIPMECIIRLIETLTMSKSGQEDGECVLLSK